jgi:hypothetical protein
VIFQFLGSRLHEYWRELDALINPEEEEEKAKKAPVVDAYSLTMLQEALYKLNGNDPAGAARCANEAIKQLEIILKHAPPPSLPVEPAEATQ